MTTRSGPGRLDRAFPNRPSTRGGVDLDLIELDCGDRRTEREKEGILGFLGGGESEDLERGGDA